MKLSWVALLAVFLFGSVGSWANSVNLFNDTPYTLKAMIYDASGALLGEFVLNARDASLWSDDDEKLWDGKSILYANSLYGELVLYEWGFLWLLF